MTKYEEKRKIAHEILKKTFGENSTIPLDILAAVLPVLPEWEVKKK